MPKLYCYVDESGQDTFAHAGRKHLFVVSVVTLTGNQDMYWHLCEHFETISHKHVIKWSKAEHQARMRYLRFIFDDDRFKGALCYSIHRTITKSQFAISTQLAIANAIHSINLPTSQVIRNTEVFVDGLSKANRRQWGAALKVQGLSGHSVHSVAKDEHHPLIRLADTVAGFIRDTIEISTTELCILKEWGKDRGVLIEV